MADTSLGKKMVERADADNLPADHELRTMAAEFDDACTGYYATPQTVSVGKFMNRWARARRTWCEYSGEPLI